MIVAYFDGETWSAATSERLIALGHPSKASLKAAISREIGNVELTIVDAQTWRATYLAAVGGEALALRDEFEAMEQSTQVEKLHSRLDLLITTTEQLRAELAAERNRAEAVAKRAEQDEQKRVKLESVEQQRQEQAATAAESAKWEDYLADKKVEVNGDTVRVMRPHYEYTDTHDPGDLNSFKVIRHFRYWIQDKKWPINEAPPQVLERI